MLSPTGMTRRRFLHAAGLAALPCLRRRVRRSGAHREYGDRPRLRFVQWNDTHVQAASRTAYRLANEKLAWLVETVNAETLFPLPDFVLGIGDLIHGESLTKLEADFDLWKKATAGLRCAFRPVAGNHENLQQEGDERHEAAYRAAFGDDRLNYSFRQGGIHFIALDNSGAPGTNRTPVGRRRNDWLRSQLSAFPNEPKIVCCHIPLTPVREEAVLRRSFGFASCTAGDAELLKLVDQHAGRVLAILSGHLHLTGVVQRKGVYHIVVSGTASYPCDFALYEVFADRVRVRMQPLPERLRTPDTDLHGRPRHPIDYTDATHPTHDAYLRGNASERAFDIARPQPGGQACVPVSTPGGRKEKER
jgi:hypothetical protein